MYGCYGSGRFPLQAQSYLCRNNSVIGEHTLERGICLTVIYWPPNEPSIKRCTCVDKRKNSGSSWTLNNNITRCTDGSNPLDTRCLSESQRQTEGFGPSVTHGWATPTKMRKKCWKKLGQYSSLSPSPTHLSHMKHHPFENKVWEIYFYKEVYSFVYWSRSLTVDCFRIYFYMYLYVAIQHHNSMRYYFFLIHKDVVYLCFSIIYVSVVS